MKKILFSLLILFSATCMLWSYSVDYVTTQASFNVAATINGGGDEARVANITNPICPGNTISFTLTFAIGGPAGATEFPKSVTFGATTTNKPGGASDVAVTGLPQTHNFTSSSSSFADPVSLTIPSTPGAYTVRITATSGTGGSHGLGSGGGLNINFTVPSNCGGGCETVGTNITVQSFCVKLHQSETIDLKATLKDEDGNTLSGETLHFSVDGNPAGDAITDGSGVATISNFNVSTLPLGDHEINVEFDGVDCAYEPSSSQGNIGVTYAAVTFQQPINADGSSVFKGGTIPVKIKVYDANGQIVSDAEAHVFFGHVGDYPIGTDAEPLANTNGDSGNLMRYDPIAQQYIFNWDITTVQNGLWQVWVDLGEGSCGLEHSVVLSIQKTGKGIKK